MTELKVEPADLELLAKNCKSLISLKIGECDLSDLIGFFSNLQSIRRICWRSIL
jgi:coronatine-insensitive protein 1